MLDIDDFRTLIVRPTLQSIGLWSPTAEELLIGTAVQESRLTYLKQRGGGPALGVCQMEPFTHDDIWRNYLTTGMRSSLAARVRELGHETIHLISRLDYAVAMARLVYLRSPMPLPDVSDVDGMAAMWKQVYNTPKGAGEATEWADNYRRYVRPG